MPMPSVSVIIPARNERQTLPNLIDQLIAQNYPPALYEILVVDGGSTDGTGDLVRRRYARRRIPVRVIDNPGKTAAAGRNAGLAAALGEVVIFLGGHCTIPSYAWLADMAEILRETRADCLCTPRPLNAPAATRTGETIARARASWLGRGEGHAETAGFVDPVQCGASIYTRYALEHTGWFDETFDRYEDVEFNLRVKRAGQTAYSDPRLAIGEQTRRNLHGLLWEMVQSGRGLERMLRKHPDYASAARVAPLGVLLALLVALYAWWQLPAMVAAIVTLPLAIFPAAVLIASMQLGLKHGWRTAWKAPWVFVSIYLGQGMGLLYEYVVPGGAAPGSELAQERRVLGASDRAA